MKNKQTTQDGPGRPAYKPVVPTGKFTKRELAKENKVNLRGSPIKGAKDYNPRYGKGKLCSLLTLTKWIATQLSLGEKGTIEQVGKLPPKGGLGAPQLVYKRHVVGTPVCNPSDEIKTAPARTPAKATGAKRGRKPGSKNKTLATATTSPVQVDLSPATKTYEEIKAILATPDAPAAPVTPITPAAPALLPVAEVVPAPAPVAETPAPAEVVAAPVAETAPVAS